MSQGEMVKQLGVQDLIHYTNISKYELDKNEPPLAIVLAYARLVGIPVEHAIDARSTTLLTPSVLTRSRRSLVNREPIPQPRTFGATAADLNVSRLLPPIPDSHFQLQVALFLLLSHSGKNAKLHCGGNSLEKLNNCRVPSPPFVEGQ